jgi:glycosyltransferase involved in cell wall biosynthesis
MLTLVDDPGLARRLGEGARAAARERFGIHRFTREWDETFRDVTGRAQARQPAAMPAGMGETA